MARTLTLQPATSDPFDTGWVGKIATAYTGASLQLSLVGRGRRQIQLTRQIAGTTLQLFSQDVAWDEDEVLVIALGDFTGQLRLTGGLATESDSASIQAQIVCSGDILPWDSSLAMDYSGVPANPAPGSKWRTPSGDVQFGGAVISRPIARYGGDVLGDSITAQSPGCSVLSMYRRGVPLIRNRGVSGDTTAQILARVPDVIADNPRECTLQGGTNDFLGGIAPATVFANLYEAWRLMTMAGITVYVVKPPPTSRAGYIKAMADGNAYLQARFLTKGIRVYTPWDQFIDPATGGWISGASPDELHPSWPTRIAAGITLGEQIGTTDAITYPTPKINAGIVANPLMLTDTAGVATGITAVLPAGATFECAALTGVLGRVQKFTSASAIRAGGSGLLWTIPATEGGLVPLKRYLCVLKINPKSAPVNMGVDIVATPFNVSTPLTPTPAATRWRVTDDEMYTVAFVVDIPAAATLTQLLIRTYPDVPAAVSECVVSVAELQFFEVVA